MLRRDLSEFRPTWEPPLVGFRRQNLRSKGFFPASSRYINSMNVAGFPFQRLRKSPQTRYAPGGSAQVSRTSAFLATVWPSSLPRLAIRPNRNGLIGSGLFEPARRQSPVRQPACCRGTTTGSVQNKSERFVPGRNPIARRRSRNLIHLVKRIARATRLIARRIDEDSPVRRTCGAGRAERRCWVSGRIAACPSIPDNDFAEWRPDFRSSSAAAIFCISNASSITGLIPR